MQIPATSAIRKVWLDKQSYFHITKISVEEDNIELISVNVCPAKCDRLDHPGQLRIFLSERADSRQMQPSRSMMSTFIILSALIAISSQGEPFAGA